MASSLVSGFMLKFLRIGNRTGKVGRLTILKTGTLQFVDKANPATCVKGELNVAVDGKLYVCSATNVWTVVGTQV